MQTKQTWLVVGRRLMAECFAPCQDQNARPSPRSKRVKSVLVLNFW
jgi:hypothetical protein